MDRRCTKIWTTQKEDIYAFNGKIISCSTDVSEDELQYVLLPKHKHSETCMKVSNEQNTCQFGAPWPPMHATIILKPLYVNKNAQCEMYVQLQSNINNLQELGTNGKDITYTQLLQELNITLEQYILALYSTLKKPKLFPSKEA